MTRLAQDAALRQGFRRGDPSALAEVYREYAPPVFALLGRGFTFSSGGERYHFDGHRQSWELESAVQDVFVRAFSPNARAGYDGVRPYVNYLLTIARNVVIDGFRSGGRETLTSDALGEADVARPDGWEQAAPDPEREAWAASWPSTSPPSSTPSSPRSGRSSMPAFATAAASRPAPRRWR